MPAPLICLDCGLIAVEMAPTCGRNMSPHKPRNARGERESKMSRSLLDLVAPSLSVLLLGLGACNKPPPAEEKPAAPAESAAPVAVAAPTPAPTGPALKIAYSDWPGWVAWDIAEQKGWFKEEGVNVELKWFEYSPSMDAFSAGKVDAVAVTNGDALVTGSSGAPSVAIVINDLSNLNDMIVVQSRIASAEHLT